MNAHLQPSGSAYFLDPVKPAWHLLDWEDYHYSIDPYGRMASILTSRGCMMGCSFCSQRLFWRQLWVLRKPDRLGEICDRANAG